ncbi:hypothetical protein KBI52_16950 [Microvirga sp. HBU67558]|nr:MULTISPECIES: hypothetical protein [unclassified Microvirga]MBQ0821883.1 hypothetical protein [Microvirga sp. HBU67558]
MNFLDLERHAQPEAAQAELDRFGNQAVSIVTLALALSGLSCVILMYVML